MRIKMVSLEDGITANGFRKVTAFVHRLEPDSTSYYVSTHRFRSVRVLVTSKLGMKGELGDAEIDEIAHGLSGADVVGFSSMTGYAELTRKIIARLRQLDPSTFIIWGGIHPIIHPEDAITADVDAICIGEGEFAFEELHSLLDEGRDFTGVRNFWFKTRSGHRHTNGHVDGTVVRNDFLPLMTNEQMETLPYPQYGEDELIYESGVGFRPTGLRDYLDNDGLGYQTLWSIGCPFHCTFCGNTKFIANDPTYKKIRHPSAEYVVEEVKHVRRRFPHISQVSFNDDSFMAITYRELERFAELWREQLDGLPFAVYGVIPNYVKKEKFDILTWAGMNRIRMGIQSGSQDILDFYKRPTPPARILEAGEVAASYAPKYHIPPAYDIIVDNPIETRQDVVDTLELLYKMPRPYVLLIYALKVIPNTELAKQIEERGIELEDISDSYAVVPRRAANLLLMLLPLWKPPRWMFDRMLKRVKPYSEEQKLYPTLGMMLRVAILSRRVVDHLRFMDFSLIPGRSGYVLWRAGIANAWRKRFVPRMPRPEPPTRRAADIARRIPLLEQVAD
jgi:anaerobic magnesium-protoporphyrin IX monomethyl ester cyclase